ncbi:MAG: carbamoyltransferase C-terminal domain-containing protein [Pseudomonadota bacterium]
MGQAVSPRYVLGIWDGHDAGAALLDGGRIVMAINEERLTRRKLEVGFPFLSVRACLANAGIGPESVTTIAVSTSDPAKTLTRLVPGLKEAYYLIRRRKKDPGPLDRFKKGFKYKFTELAPNRLSVALSRLNLHALLRKEGFRRYRLHLIDHHRAHAEAAARLSGFPRCLALTLDGVGDGLCGSIYTYEDSRLKRIAALPSNASLGIFFEHVTNLMNMRELEDEGKVMALANYAYPISDSENPLMEVIQCRGLSLVSPHSVTAMYRQMKKIFWRFPSEQFAFMAQQVVERRAMALLQNALAKTGMDRVAVAGGLFSNIKFNMKAAEHPSVKQFFVFPHMGDGGLALGAAIAAASQDHGQTSFSMDNLYLGPSYADTDIPALLDRHPVTYRRLDDPARVAADCLLANEVILWFQGAMELGPRALGNRSILARADSVAIKDRLNMALKKRVWYQPFCPSMLETDAPALLHTEDQDTACNRFMTSGFRVRREHLGTMAGVINVDGTCRPQFVGDDNPRYRDLLGHIKSALGYGVVLNTSFNIHGDPMVCSPEDALDTLFRTGVRHLFLEDYLVENPNARD